MATKIWVIFYGLVLLIANACCAQDSSDDVVVKPTKLWRFLGDNGEAVQQRFRENIEEFSVGRIECLRYCIESKTVDDASKILHLTWKLNSKAEPEMGSAAIADKDITSEIMHGKSIMPSDSWNLNRCTFSIVIGCEISPTIENNFTDIERKFLKSLKPNLDILDESSDNTSATLNFINERIADKSDLGNQTEMDFSVEPNQAEVSAIVLGNIFKIDLKMPIATSTTSTSRHQAPRLTVAVSRMRDASNTRALRLNVLNPPPGGWRLALKGMNVRRVVVTSSVVPEFNDDADARSLNYFAGNGERTSGLENDNSQVPKKIGISSRQIHVKTDDERMEQSSRIGEISARIMTNEMSEDPENQNSFRFPLTDNDTSTRSVSTRLNTDQIEDRMLEREAIELEDLGRSLNNELPIKKHLIVEVSSTTNLIANPGSIHRVTFDITNNHAITVRHYLEARSTNFRILGIRPAFGFVEIAPGQTISVAVDIQVPPFVSESVANSITLRVQGIESTEKTVNVYVRALGTRVYDDVRPNIYFYFNNNCAGRTSAEKCQKSYWSVDITVQDSESGLKSVVSTPRGVYPRSQYESGTTSPVYFYYSNNCCNRVLDVSATDVSGNVYSRRIDVAVWYNLTDGEIAAVVIGTLFIVLLIVLIVVTALYCANRRKSHDLPYSQRYGSRSGPTRTE